MRLKVKDLDITTGGPLVVVLNAEDAKKLDLHVLDRIKIKRGKKIETVVVDIAKTGKTVRKGYIGILEEVLESLKIKHNDIVKIIPARKPLSLEFIRKKLDGKNLDQKEIDQIVWDITHNKLSQIELTYFVAACYTNVMSMKETIMLTKSIVKHGEVLKLNRCPVIDKHCIGGLAGNRTTMVLVPIIAAAGLVMPKTSSRSITSPAGTADTMEILSGVSFSIKEMRKIIQKTNACIVWGGGLNLAPADDKIISVEKPLGIDAESQLLASIMAKKHSVSSTHILIDIPVGKDAKVKDRSEAIKLKKDFEVLGKNLQKKVKVIITDGSSPIGKGIGPALEAIDVLKLLRRDKDRAMDLEKKCVMMATEILKLANIKDPRKKVLEILNSGKAYEKMQDIIKAQGGKVKEPEDIPAGRFSFDVKSFKVGLVKEINNSSMIKIARIAGAPVNKGAGLFLNKSLGDKVSKGDTLFRIYSESEQKLCYAKDVCKELEHYKVYP